MRKIVAIIIMVLVALAPAASAATVDTEYQYLYSRMSQLINTLSNNLATLQQTLKETNQLLDKLTHLISEIRDAASSLGIYILGAALTVGVLVLISKLIESKRTYDLAEAIAIALKKIALEHSPVTEEQGTGQPPTAPDSAAGQPPQLPILRPPRYTTKKLNMDEDRYLR